MCLRTRAQAEVAARSRAVQELRQAAVRQEEGLRRAQVTGGLAGCCWLLGMPVDVCGSLGTVWDLLVMS